ncbi:hypothetical protein CcrKarma_gp072 [Caulobacter virus Karma]|uniref:Uncharacterized protein n=1 Tax=Caulobacter phage CcrSwift TaxID=2927984 RepID=K4K726_9CAUD|nr:hypothetical protein CcrMagneto_gp069 [Caulobacter virus Magneto]YP_006989452.1 hypothetical protein CcrKarma_gp072 [Caulobacter virus Karma]YP_006989802.1 hypothetical protein D870_gp069 [Caulobacter phage CcrSwift]AFU87239.1 hypothetical protein CcrMagneto_gp069 [Caulobacter virus Magneto]AFU87589.1 hypothetical protein CcrKarma_gp072 [Caulobacter virus Karma]AFU88387.1 hypothetical protein CcrSwift_gp069 [Caulobacter phage CcrSwift]
MVELGYFSKTWVVDVTAASDVFANPGNGQTFMLRADRKIHIARSVDNNAEATTGDCLLLADEPASFAMEVGGSIAFILADGETDGKIFITQVN